MSNIDQTFTATTAFTRRLARGHRIRIGHDLVGYYVLSDGYDFAVKLVRTCCKES